VISAVDSRTLTVTRDGRDPVTCKLGARTRVVVAPREGGHYPDASPEFLRPGMGVRFRYAPGVLDRLSVTSVPAGAWPAQAPASAAPRAPAVSARVVRTDARAGTLVAEIDGREETLSVDDRRLLADVRPGDQLSLVIEDRAGGRRVITAIH